MPSGLRIPRPSGLLSRPRTIRDVTIPELPWNTESQRCSNPCARESEAIPGSFQFGGMIIRGEPEHMRDKFVLGVPAPLHELQEQTHLRRRKCLLHLESDPPPGGPYPLRSCGAVPNGEGASPPRKSFRAADPLPQPQLARPTFPLSRRKPVGLKRGIKVISQTAGDTLVATTFDRLGPETDFAIGGDYRRTIGHHRQIRMRHRHYGCQTGKPPSDSGAPITRAA